jgi:excisionase family DNA binding protein
MRTPTASARTVPRLMTPDDVAELLGIPRLTVMRLARAGKIPSIKIGKVYRFRPTTIEAWLTEQEGQALQPGTINRRTPMLT